MSDFDVVVVGGGISGLSFGHFVARAGKRVLLLEKEATAGGCIHSHREDGFWFEMGAHTAYNSYGNLLSILEDRHGLSRLLKREKAPFRLFADGKVQPIARPIGKLELLLHAPRILFLKKKDVSVRDYYGRIVGPRNFERVFSQVFSAVFSQRADDFPTEMMFKKRERRKDVLRSYTLQGGLSTIADCIEGTPNLEIRTGAEVSAIAKKGDGFAVIAGGTTWQAPKLALALPPSAAAPLLGGLHPVIAGALAKIRSTPIESVGVAVRSEALALERVGGIISLDPRFFSAVSRDVVPDAQWRGFAFHVKPGTGLDPALAMISQVLGVERGKFEKVVQRRVVLPSPVVGHAQTVAEIDRALGSGPLFMTGNYFAGLSLEDCVSRSRQEADRFLGTR